MTERLYYTNAEIRTFEAMVLACDAIDDRFHVHLDRTAFYPTSGGQPFDVGTLGDAAVIDVIDEDPDVVHVTTKALAAGDIVRGEIDWDLHYVDATIIRAHQHAAGARRDGAIGG